MLYYTQNTIQLFDISILVLNIIIFYFIMRLEKVHCFNNADWRPVFLKNYTIANIIITTLSMLVSVNKWSLIVYGLIRLPLHIFLLYTVFTYTRELNKDFASVCSKLIKPQDEYILEFLQLYTLLQVLYLVFIIIIVLMVLTSYLPRYKKILKKIKTN